MFPRQSWYIHQHKGLVYIYTMSCIVHYSWCACIAAYGDSARLVKTAVHIYTSQHSCYSVHNNNIASSPPSQPFRRWEGPGDEANNNMNDMASWVTGSHLYYTMLSSGSVWWQAKRSRWGVIFPEPLQYPESMWWTTVQSCALLPILGICMVTCDHTMNLLIMPILPRICVVWPTIWIRSAFLLSCASVWMYTIIRFPGMYICTWILPSPLLSSAHMLLIGAELSECNNYNIIMQPISLGNNNVLTPPSYRSLPTGWLGGSEINSHLANGRDRTIHANLSETKSGTKSLKFLT